MQRGKKLQDYIGRNEKTKLVVKIQKVRTISANFKHVGSLQTSSKLIFYTAVHFRKDRGRQRESL